LNSFLKLGNIQRKREAWQPLQRFGFNQKQLVSQREGVAEMAERFTKIRAGLGVSGICPKLKGEALPQLGGMTVQDQVCQQCLRSSADRAGKQSTLIN
jgi:hypothetical protein